MGQQPPSQTPPVQSTHGFQDAGDAFDAIKTKMELLHNFRKTGIEQACNQILQTDPPPLWETLLKSGLKIGLAAAAGAVGAATGGMGWIALGAIGAGFGIGGEAVDAIFSSNNTPTGVEPFRTKRKNVLDRMYAKEQDEVRAKLRASNATAADWDRAYNDYDQSKSLNALQNLEIDSTVDGWMNALSGQKHGTGGSLSKWLDANGNEISWMEALRQQAEGKTVTQVQGEGDEEFSSATTGRLHLRGRAFNDGSVKVGLFGANMEGLDNQELRNRYLNRKISDIGCFVTFSCYMGSESGGISFTAGNSTLAFQGSDQWKALMGRLPQSGPAFVSADHNYADHAIDGARAIYEILAENTIASFGISNVGN